jgi:hypothetical protein
MPDSANVRVVTLEAAVADVSNRPRPFFIINREYHGEGEIELPMKILARLPDGFTGDVLVAPTTLAELNQARLSVGRHRDQFDAGELVMVAVQKLHETPERAQGGQTVADLEERARDGLYVTVALATERMRACADCREHWKMDIVARRGEIFARLEPHLPGLSPINLFREGQKLVAAWHPGQTASPIMKSAYSSIAARPGAQTGRVNIAAIEDEQMDLVLSAGAVYAKTLGFLTAQHEMSDLIRDLKDSAEFKNANEDEQCDMQAKLLREKAPAKHQELAHDMQGGPSIVQFMRAAWSMDFNPAWVFLNKVFAYKTAFDCAMLLGRAERRIGAMLEPKHIARLKRFMALADAADGHGGAANAEVEEARCLRDLALHVKPRAGWEEFFTIAEADGGSLWVTRVP